MKIDSGQAPSTLIPEYIGSDFDSVLEVADNIEAIKVVAKNIEIFEVPHASETTAGITKIATQPEVNQKTNDSHIVTPKKLGEYAAPLVHTHTTATPAESGFLAATDKQKLDGIDINANNYIHPISDGSLHVPATGTDNNGKLLKAGATAGSLVWDTIHKADVGLSNVDNTSDVNKPISTATQTALNSKETTIALGTTAQYWRGDKSWQSLDKAAVGLDNVDNTTDLNKPISTATQAALDGKSGITHTHTTMDVGAAPLVHTHVIADVIDLQTTLDSKSVAGHTHSYLPLTGGTLTGAVSGTAFTGALIGNASTATSADKLTTTRSISLTGDVIGSVLFDGSTDVTFAATHKSSGVTAGTYKSVTVDANGHITAGTNPTTLAGYGITDAVSTTFLGVANGVATLNASGLIPSTQLPSYVDDVIEYANLAGFPATGEASKIYIALDTNKTYRWSGTGYVYITSGAIDSVAGKTGVVTLVKSDVGLNNVDNTSDLSKPVSTAQQKALNLKANLVSPVLTGTPTAPTAEAGTNTSQLATTAFVTVAVSDKANTTHTHAIADVSGLQTALDGKQVADADLTAIAGLADTSGFLKKTAANTWALDTNTYLTGNQSITVSGDASGTGTTAISLTLANSGASAGTYRSVTVDSKGRVTSGTNPTTLAGYGIIDAIPSSSKGVVNGVATLDATGKVPAAQLPLGAVQSVDGLTGVVVLPLATEAAPGKAAIATTADVATGTDDTKFITPAKLAGYAQPIDATLTAMSGVVTAADKLIYFNGADTATSTTVTAFARTLLDDTSAAGAQATLGVLANTGAFKTSANIATTANLTATYTNGTSGVGAKLTNRGTLAALVIDGVTAANNMRVLVKDQTTASQNGIYTVTNTGSASVAWVLTRATDSDVTAELAGAVISVDQGTVNGAALFTNDWKKTYTVGTTAMRWRAVLDSVNYSTYAQPKNTTLTALAGVTTAADKLIYATAPDVFTTTSITPFARTLIDDVDAAAMRTTLGIDGLPILSFIGDTPPANPWNGATWYCTDDGRTYVYYVDTDSSQWVENSPQSPATTDTLSGTNANGEYTKFADGTLICWVSTTTSASAAKAITYPMAFISNPVCTVTVEAATPFIVTTCFPSVTGIGINGWNMSSARVAVVCKLMAVGRWK